MALVVWWCLMFVFGFGKRISASLQQQMGFLDLVKSVIANMRLIMKVRGVCAMSIFFWITIP